MNRLEQPVGKIDQGLTKAQQRALYKESFEWRGATTQTPPNSYTRECARELLAATGATAQHDKYDGSPDTYIAQGREGGVPRLVGDPVPGTGPHDPASGGPDLRTQVRVRGPDVLREREDSP